MVPVRRDARYRTGYFAGGGLVLAFWKRVRGLVRPLVLLVGAAAVCVWTVAPSDTFHQCIERRKEDNTYHALREHHSVLTGFIKRSSLNGRCAGEFIDANHDAINALATVVVALFTLTLSVATSRLERLGTRQIEDARLAFVATHRPRIVLRRIIRMTVGLTDQIFFYFQIANVGYSSCKIVFRDLYIESVGDTGIPTHAPGEDFAEIPMAAGQIERMKFVSPYDTWDMHLPKADTPPPGRLHFVGRIVYEDETGVLRETGFRRIFDFETFRFVRSDDPDDEYSD